MSLTVIKTGKSTFTAANSSSFQTWAGITPNLKITDLAHIGAEIGLSPEEIGKLSLVVANTNPQGAAAMLGTNYREASA